MCGIFGISTQQAPVNLDIYEALLMLQHRGQDAAGMVTYDGDHFHDHKGNGLVHDVFDQDLLSTLVGTTGIGHVRYPTAGSLSAKEAQPFFVNAPFGIYLVHNGNLTNTEEMRKLLEANHHRHLRTSSDSEVLLNIFADQLYRERKTNEDYIESVFKAASETMKLIKGAYSVILMIDEVGLLAFRDPHGIRPLSLGKRDSKYGEDWAFSSENVGFDVIGCEKVRDINPGEAVLITKEGECIARQCVKGTLNPCIFEYIYLSRPDTMLDGISVYKTQKRLGQQLVPQIKAANLDIDAIIPIPDSSRPIAIEMAKHLNVKYREGIVKNRYVGRTFIMPDQPQRERSVRRKHNAIPLEFKNRSVLLVDDSIVRGTTMKKIIQMCRQAGAKNVYVASAAPPVRFPNVYGIDMPTRHELIAHNLSIEEIGTLLGADALFYQTIEGMVAAATEGNPNIKEFETSVFSGKYVTGDVSPEYLSQLESSRRVTSKTQKIIPTMSV